MVMTILTKKAASYSIADLEGTWADNELESPGPMWARGPLTGGSDGLFSGTLNNSDGSTQSRSGIFSITTGGIIIVTGSTAPPSLRCVMDSGKTIIVCTNTGNGGQTDMNILTKKAASKSPTEYTLTVDKSGTGSGTVTTNSGTINWSGSTGTASYSSGTSIMLTANANSGSTFTSWTGCDSTSSNTCTVSMTSAKSVTATFTLNPQYDLTITKSGTGAGGISSSPAGINCGDNCVASFNSGAVVSLTATPDTGSTFTGCLKVR